MKRSVFVISILSMALAIGLSAQSISTQGVLRDSDGHSVADGDYNMSFTIYGDVTGGSHLWGPFSKTVSVENGMYQVVLGEVNPITSFNSDGRNYLEIAVENETMSPRLRLNVTPYELANLTGSSNALPSSGNVGIGTTNPQSKLVIVATGDNVDLIQLDQNSDDTKKFSFQGMFAGTGSTGNAVKFRSHWVDKIMFWRGDGNVGIGTDAPGGKLTVKGGSVYVDNNNFGGTPTVDIAIGDTDTGLKSGGDGKLNIMADNVNTISVRPGKVGIGTTTPDAKLHVNGGTDISLSGGGYIISGQVNATNIAIDNNEIMARNNGNPATLYLNADGGDVQIGGYLRTKVPTTGSFIKPFQFVRFDGGSGINVTIPTTYNSTDWIAAVVGFDMGYGDLDEGGSHDLWQINCAVAANGNWEIFCDGPTHGNHPEWQVYVMFVSTKFGSATWQYKAY